MTTSLTRKFFSRKIAFLALLVVVMLTTIQPSHSLVVVRPFSRNVRRSTGARFARLASVRPDLEQGQNMFDSSSSSSSSHDLKTTDQESSLPSLEEEQDGEMSLWMARSILLLVAAIWGTNFAVRVVAGCWNVKSYRVTTQRHNLIFFFSSSTVGKVLGEFVFSSTVSSSTIGICLGSLWSCRTRKHTSFIGKTMGCNFGWI